MPFLNVEFDTRLNSQSKMKIIMEMLLSCLERLSVKI